MKINKVFSLVGAGLMFAVANHAIAADELVVASIAKAGKSVVSLDILTEGSAVAIQFNIDLPKGIDASQVDLSNCMADLPKTHKGQCNVAKGQIIGIAYNDDGVALPAGLVSIGHVAINTKFGAARARAGTFKVATFVAANIEGKELPTRSTVSAN